jgi:hypothetical protein
MRPYMPLFFFLTHKAYVMLTLIQQVLSPLVLTSHWVEDSLDMMQNLGQHIRDVVHTEGKNCVWTLLHQVIHITQDTETHLDYSSTSPQEVDNDFGALIWYTMRNKSNLEPQYENRVSTELVMNTNVTFIDVLWPWIWILNGRNVPCASVAPAASGNLSQYR